MKKVYFILAIAFTFLLQVEATTWLFVWDEATTTIEVPLGSTIQNYTHIPKATLYKDHEPLTDAEIEYISTGDWLYLLTDVDTSKVGNYQVWYKAIESKYRPGQCQGYKTLVTFKVVDYEAPVLNSYPERMKYYIGQEKPDYKSKIIATDNSDTCDITIDDSLVLYEIPGNYPVYIQANDGYNITMAEICLEVEDPIGPVVTFKGANNRIILAKGESPNLESYFTAYDQIDGDVTHTIFFEPFDTAEEKVFDLKVNFKDYNENVSSVLITIEIVDQDEIEIELYNDELILEYDKDFFESLRNNLKRALYGKTDIRNLVNIDVSNIQNKVGSYIATYSYSVKDKVKIVDCRVKLLSVSAPILLVQNVSIPIGHKPNYLDYITVQDASDSDIASKIQWNDTLVDYTKAGTYAVSVSVVNSSNLSSTETIYVSVYDKEDSNSDLNLQWIVFCICFGVLVLAGVIIGYIYKKRKQLKS